MPLLSKPWWDLSRGVGDGDKPRLLTGPEIPRPVPSALHSRNRECEEEALGTEASAEGEEAMGCGSVPLLVVYAVGVWGMKLSAYIVMTSSTAPGLVVIAVVSKSPGLISLGSPDVPGPAKNCVHSWSN